MYDSMIKLRGVFAKPHLYISWLSISFITQVAAYFIDPYVFGFAILGSAWVCGALLLGALVSNWRILLWALLSVLPTGVSFIIVSTFSWA